MLPENGVAVGDRGFCSRKLFEQFIQNGALFIIRIKFNWKWDENHCDEIWSRESSLFR